MRKARWILVVGGLAFFMIVFGVTQSYAAGPIAAKIAATKVEATNVNAWTLVFLSITLVLLFVLPQKHLLSVFMIAVCFIPVDQRFILAELDFSMLRILTIFAALRLIVFGRIRKITWSSLDYLMFSWIVVSSSIYILQWQTSAACLNRMGSLIDTLLVYWIFRQVLYSTESISSIISTLAFCALAMAPFVFYERISETNPFGVLGRTIAVLREGKLRCSGSFPHPVVMGAFFSLLVPLFLAMEKIKKKALFFSAAIAACFFLVIASNSSTSFGVLGVAVSMPILVRFRRHIRRGVVLLALLLAVLHFVMMVRSGRPVWFLLTRADFTGSSTSWYRYYLFDTFLDRFGEWWLLGTRTTAMWDPWGRLADITNQFVLEGVKGGAIGLILFLCLLGVAFSGLVRSLLRSTDPKDRVLAWHLLVVLVSVLAAFFALSFFGQLVTLWYLLLAMMAYLFEKQETEKRMLPRSQALAGTMRR